MLNVSACLVTRGDVDMNLITDSLIKAGIDEIIVYDNSKRQDLAVYGRYAAIAEARNTLIYTQDDDCILPPESIEEIVWTSDSGGDAYGQLVCNMPPEFSAQPFYKDAALVGFGACFHRSLPETAFSRYTHADTGLFRRRCDIFFTTVTPHVNINVPVRNMWWSEDSSRMWKQSNHLTERQGMLELALKVRDS